MRKENQINLSILKMQSLTDTNGRQHPDSRIWWVALWEERLDRVDGEGERHDGDCRRSHLEMMMIVMMVVVVVIVVMDDGEGERHDGDCRRPHLKMMMIVMMVVVVVMVARRWILVVGNW